MQENFVNSVHTRGIVKTRGFTRGVCKNQGFYYFERFSCGIPREQAILRKPKTPRKSPEQWTFLSLTFYNAPSLDTVNFGLTLRTLFCSGISRGRSENLRKKGSCSTLVPRLCSSWVKFAKPSFEDVDLGGKRSTKPKVHKNTSKEIAEQSLIGASPPVL